MKKDLAKLRTLPATALSIMRVEALNFVKSNFQNQGFDDNGITRWKPRKTTDRQSRDLTRYRTNRHGSKGSLTAFGRQNKGRAILVGHNTGGDKLKNSFTARIQNHAVVIASYKPYAKAHNEGEGRLPRRRMIGASQTLTNAIKRKLHAHTQKLFGK